MAVDKGTIGETIELQVRDGKTNKIKRHLVSKNGVSGEVEAKHLKEIQKKVNEMSLPPRR